MITLNQLQKGQKAKIIKFLALETPDYLMQLGCFPGDQVELIQIAPFNDPLYIKVNETCIALRREIAQTIAIEPSQP